MQHDLDDMIVSSSSRFACLQRWLASLRIERDTKSGLQGLNRREREAPGRVRLQCWATLLILSQEDLGCGLKGMHDRSPLYKHTS